MRSFLDGLTKPIRWRYLLSPGGLVKTGFVLMMWVGTASAVQPPSEVRVAVDWKSEGATSSIAPSLVVIPYPDIRKGRRLHDEAIAAIKMANVRFARYLPFCSHPRLSIPALRAPTKDQTFWDFSLIDPDLVEFLETTKGRQPTLNFGPIPHWMFKGGESVVYASDPDKADYEKCALFTKGELVDPTGEQVADYFARIASWYTRGGFTDELGKYHHSGFYYELPWWGVLNEPDMEQGFSPQQYTRVYDAVVAAVREVSPATKFIGLNLASLRRPEFIDYFLDPKNHRPGTPIDMIGVHGNRIPAVDQSIDSWQYTAFDQLAALTTVMGYIDTMRKRLAPTTLIKIGEFVNVLPEDTFGFQYAHGLSDRKPVDTTDRIPRLHWNLVAALYATAFVELSGKGVDVLSATQLYGYGPFMMPSASMIDPRSGAPLPVIHVLKLFEDQLSPSRDLVPTKISPFSSSEIAAQAFRTDKGRKLLLVNKRSRPMKVLVDGSEHIARIDTIDELGVTQSTQSGNRAMSVVSLRPFAVAVITFR